MISRGPSTGKLLGGIFVEFCVGIHESPSEFVNVFLGTEGNGNTFPGATLPHGMVQLTPIILPEGGFSGNASFDRTPWAFNSGYHRTPNQATSPILGFAHTALSGTGVHDGGDFAVLPCFFCEEDGQAVVLLHEHEVASPGYYKARLRDKHRQVDVELTATPRGGMLRASFHASRAGANAVPRMRFQLETYLDELRHGGSFIWKDQARPSILVGTRASTKSHICAADHTTYWHARFEPPFDHVERIDMTSTYVASWNSLRDLENAVVLVRVGLSHTNSAGAEINSAYELGRPGSEFTFADLQARAREEWDKHLGLINISAPSADLKRFYTALYHASLGPTLLADVNRTFLVGNDDVYLGTRSEVQQTAHMQYSTFSMWDSYRAHQPLLNLIKPELAPDLAESLLSVANASRLEHKPLPRWVLYGAETGCMDGHPASVILAEMAIKGLINESLARRAFERMKAAGDIETYVSEQHFIPAGQPGCVSRALEIATADFCISRLADRLGDRTAASTYFQRSRLYEQYYDSSSRLFLPRLPNGQFIRVPPNIYPDEGYLGEHFFKEGTALQYLFMVPHDAHGLARLLGPPWLVRLIFGSREHLAERLDEYFYRSEIQVPEGNFFAIDLISGHFGGHCHGNEPGHHTPYLYNVAGEPWNTQRIVNELQKLYTLEHLPGQDDVGQMSAWLVWTMLGLYPLSPCSAEYELGRPFVAEATIAVEGGKLHISAKGIKEPSNMFVKEVWWNEERWRHTSLPHDQIARGGTLRFIMGPIPVDFRKEASAEGNLSIWLTSIALSTICYVMVRCVCIKKPLALKAWTLVVGAAFCLSTTWASFFWAQTFPNGLSAVTGSS